MRVTYWLRHGVLMTRPDSLSSMSTSQVSHFKTYVRKYPLYCRARVLEEGDVVYDGKGNLMPFRPGEDVLIDQETDPFTLDRQLFDQLYAEVQEENGAGNREPNVSPT